MTVVAKRRCGQLAVKRMLIRKPLLFASFLITGQALLTRQPQTPNLAFADPIKVMDMQVLVTFAFGVPHDRDLDRLNIIDRNASNSPLRRQLAAGFVDTVFTTQRDVYRGLRFGGKP